MPLVHALNRDHCTSRRRSGGTGPRDSHIGEGVTERGGGGQGSTCISSSSSRAPLSSSSISLHACTMWTRYRRYEQGTHEQGTRPVHTTERTTRRVRMSRSAECMLPAAHNINTATLVKRTVFAIESAMNESFRPHATLRCRQTLQTHVHERRITED